MRINPSDSNAVQAIRDIAIALDKSITKSNSEIRLKVRIIKDLMLNLSSKIDKKDDETLEMMDSIEQQLDAIATATLKNGKLNRGRWE